MDERNGEDCADRTGASPNDPGDAGGAALLLEQAAVPFAGTLRALAAERRAAVPAAFHLALALSIAAAGCALAVPVARVERARGARLECAGGAIPLAAPVSGRIAENRLRLGMPVRAGEVLLRLEPAPEIAAAAREERARADSLAAQAGALTAQLAGLDRGAAAGEAAGRESTIASRLGAAAATAAAALATAQEERAARLRGLGLVSAAALEQARGEAAARRLAARGATAEQHRQCWEAAAAASARAVNHADLLRQLAALRGAQEAAAAAAARWQAEIERTCLRAPTAGEIATVAAPPPGAAVQAGQPVATLVPAGPLRLVADLDPNALGSIRPGQPARFWLAACAAPACRGLPATVTAVAGEATGGRLRVELALAPPPPPHRDGPRRTAPRLRHGLAVATLEIEVGRASPLEILLRGPAGAPAEPW